jgi:hypothetical protein
MLIDLLHRKSSETAFLAGTRWRLALAPRPVRVSCPDYGPELCNSFAGTAVP